MLGGALGDAAALTVTGLAVGQEAPRPEDALVLAAEAALASLQPQGRSLLAAATGAAAETLALVARITS